MKKRLPHQRFERLARLVGRALARKWMRVLDRKSAPDPGVPQPQRQRHKKRRGQRP